MAKHNTKQVKTISKGSSQGAWKWPGKSGGASRGSHLPGVAAASRWPAASAPTVARGEAVIDLLRTNPDLANVRHSRRRAISRPKALCRSRSSEDVKTRESPAVARAELALAGVFGALERRAAVDQWRGYLEAERLSRRAEQRVNRHFLLALPARPPPRARAHVHHMGWWAKRPTRIFRCMHLLCVGGGQG